MSRTVKRRPGKIAVLMGDIRYTELDWREAILLGAALRNGLLKAVAEARKPAADVAWNLGLDRRAVYAVLSALAELGILDEGEGGYVLREDHRRPLLDPESEDYVGRSVVHRFELIHTWSRLPETLKSGRPLEDRTAPDYGANESSATFIGAMCRGALPSADAVADAMLPHLPEGASLLDVGGGPGANAEAFVRRGARVTVFDLPEVIGLMGERLAAAGIATASGDMRAGLPDGPFDAVYFGNTSHMYGPEENREFFTKMRRSLVPGGLLVVRDYLRGRSEDAALFAVNMLLLTAGGGTYTAGQYEAWLTEAGFEGIEVVPVPGRSTHLVLARNRISDRAKR